MEREDLVPPREARVPHPAPVREESGPARPAKAGLFSGSQSHRGNRQDLRSWGCLRGGNEAEGANRPSHPRDGERTGPSKAWAKRIRRFGDFEGLSRNLAPAPGAFYLNVL